MGRQKAALDWDGHDFVAMFKSLKKTAGLGQVKIILGDDMSYLLALSLPSAAKPEEIVEKANELIPETITAENSVICPQDPGKDGNNIVQVFAVAESLLHSVSQAAIHENINVEFLCPVLSLIANSFPDKNLPVLFIWTGEEMVASVIKGGVVYGSAELAENGQQKISELVDYVQGRFGFKPTEICANADIKDVLPNIKLESKKITLDPYMLADNHNASENDQTGIPTIKLSHKKDVETAKISKEPEIPLSGTATNKPAPELQPDTLDSEKKNYSTLIWSAVLILIIVGALGFFIYQYFVLPHGKL
jgi:hypothetical protein